VHRHPARRESPPRDARSDAALARPRRLRSDHGGFLSADPASLYVLMEERRGEFDGLRADRALAEIRRTLEREPGDVAVLGYHGADCDPAERAIGAADVLRVTAPGREHGTFEMTDAVCARDAAGASRLLAQALDEGAQPIAVIGALAAALKPILAGAEFVARGRRPEEAER